MKIQIIKTLSQTLTTILFLVCTFITTCILFTPFKASKIESTPLKVNKIELDGLCGCHTYRDTLISRHKHKDSIVVRVAFIYEDSVKFDLGKNQLQRCKDYIEDYSERKEKEWTVYNGGALLNKYADCYFEHEYGWYVRIFDYSMPISRRGLEDDLKIKRRNLDTCDIKAEGYGVLLQLPTSERNPIAFIVLFITLIIILSKLIQRL